MILHAVTLFAIIFWTKNCTSLFFLLNLSILWACVDCLLWRCNNCILFSSEFKPTWKMTFVDQMSPPQTAILKGHSWVMLAKNMQTDKTLLSLLSEKFCVCIQITKQLREPATTQPTIPNNSKNHKIALWFSPLWLIWPVGITEWQWWRIINDMPSH